ncbi:MAG: hypothetical protein GXX91_10760 [Verrucomicrobiaceae bacterium]|nr:hypothetical protein [Verrucomicrobiaceae bacterium]
MSGNTDEEENKHRCEEERNLRAELKEVWQEESPATAKVTDRAEEVDGKIKLRCEEERNLRAELEEVWQEESPTTAKVTDLADEVDGQLGTRSCSEDAED